MSTTPSQNPSPNPCPRVTMSTSTLKESAARGPMTRHPFLWSPRLCRNSQTGPYWDWLWGGLGPTGGVILRVLTPLSSPPILRRPALGDGSCPLPCPYLTPTPLPPAPPPPYTAAALISRGADRPSAGGPAPALRYQRRGGGRGPPALYSLCGGRSCNCW